MTCLKPGHGAFECKSWLGAEERPTQTMDKVLETSHKFFLWFGRVPTASNPANPRSRMCFDTAILKTGRRINISVPSHLEDVGLASGVLESMDPFVWITYPNAILRKKSVVPVQLHVSFIQNFHFQDHFFANEAFPAFDDFYVSRNRVVRFCPSVLCVLRLWINNFFTGNSQGCGVPIAKFRIETF